MNKLKIIKENNTNSWYKKGLRFKCTQCGKCCSGKDGYVWINSEDVNKISKFLKITEKEFLKKYTKWAYGRLSLIDANEKGDCIFLKNKKCTIYQVRPQQCKSFPWWEHVLKDEESWIALKEFCEGIDHPDSEFYSMKEIEENLKK